MSHVFHLGLTGWPLAHSLSPRLHHAALQACHLSGEYALYPIPPDDLTPSQPPPNTAHLGEAGGGPSPGFRQSELFALLRRVRNGELDGLNVTIPHKQAVLPLLDELTPTAQAVGAANMLYRAGEHLVGENTDAPAFWEDLQQQFELPKQGQALVLGAGGAARGVVYTLAQHGWQVHLAARNPEQAQQLAASFAHLAPAPVAIGQPLAEAAATMTKARLTLIVNTTPLGMHPYEGISPWPEALALPEGCQVYDLIYNPAETLLLRQARRQGLKAANGLGMLIHQAALAFLRWTSLPDEKLPMIVQAMQRATENL